MTKNIAIFQTRRSGRRRAEAPLIESPLRESPTYLVRFAQLRAFDEFHHQFAGLSITPTRFAVFALIVSNSGIRPGAIAEYLNIKSSNVASIVNFLTQNGLVERLQDTEELRAARLFPTAAGRRAFKEMWQEHQHMDEAFLKPLSPAERKTFLKLLHKIL